LILPLNLTVYVDEPLFIPAAVNVQGGNFVVDPAKFPVKEV
jgi:hypothetical protein